MEQDTVIAVAPKSSAVIALVQHRSAAHVGIKYRICSRGKRLQEIAARGGCAAPAGRHARVTHHPENVTPMNATRM